MKRDQSHTVNSGAYFGSKTPNKWTRNKRDFPGSRVYNLNSRLSSKISYSLGRKSKSKINIDSEDNKIHSRNLSVQPKRNLQLKTNKSDKLIPISYQGLDDWNHNQKGAKFSSSIKKLEFTPYSF